MIDHAEELRVNVARWNRELERISIEMMSQLNDRGLLTNWSVHKIMEAWVEVEAQMTGDISKIEALKKLNCVMCR